MVSLEERLSRLESALRESVKERNHLSSIAIAKDKELADLLRKHALLKTNLEKADKSTMNLAEKATRSTILERKITDLEKSTAKTRSLVDAKTSTLEKLQAERKELRDLADSLQAQVAELLSQRDTLETELRESAAASAAAKAAADARATAESEADVEGLRMRGAALARAVEEAEDACARVTVERDDALARLTSTIRELETVVGELEEARAQVTDLEREVSALEARVLSLEEEMKRAAAARDEARARVAELEQELAATKDTLSQVEADNAKVSEVLLEMETRNLDVALLIQSLESSVSEKTEQLRTLEQLRETETAEYVDVIETMKQVLTQQQSERREEMVSAKERIETLESQLEVAASAVLLRDQQVEALSLQEESLRSDLVNLRAELEATADLADTWRVHYDDMKSNRGALVERIAALEDDVEVSASRLALAADELKAHQARVESLEKDIARLNVALDEAADALVNANSKHADDAALTASQMEVLRLQLAEERQVRAGEKDMAELRIATIQAAAKDSVEHKAQLVVELEAKIQQLNTEMEAKSAERDALSEKHRQEVNQLKLELNEQADLFAEFRERAYDNEMAAEEAAIQVEEMERKMKASAAKHAENAKEMEAAFKKIIEEFRSEIQVLEAAKLELSQKLEDANRSIEAGVVHRRGSDASIAELKQKEASLESEIGSLKTELSAAKNLADEAELARLELAGKLDETSSRLSASIVDLNDKIAVLESAVQSEKANSATLAAEFDRKSTEFAEQIKLYNERVSELELELSGVRKENADMASAILDSSRAHQAALSHVNELKKQLEDETEAHAKTKAGLEIELRTVAEASSKTKRLSDLLEAETDKAKALLAQVDQLQEAKQDGEVVVQRLSVELETERGLRTVSERELATERDTVVIERRRSQDLADSVEVQRVQVMGLKAELAAKENELQKEVMVREQHEQRIQVLEDELESRKKAADDIKKQLDDVCDTLSVERNSRTDLEARHSELQLTLQTSHKANEEMILSLNTTIEEIKKQLESSSDRVNSLEKSLAEKQEELDRRSQEFSKYHEASKKTVADLKAVAESNNLVLQEKDERLEELNTRVVHMSADLETRETSIRDLKNSLEIAETERENLRKNATDLKAANEILSKSLLEKDSMLKDLQSEVAAVKLRNANEVGRRDDEIRALNERLKQMEATVYGLQATVNAAGAVTDQLAIARAHFDNEMNLAHANEATLREALERSDLEAQSLKSDNERLRESLEKSESKLSEVQETLSSQVNFLSQHYKTAFDDIKKLSTVNADLMGHQNSSQKIRHIAKLKEELMKIKQEHTQLSRERDQLRRKNLALERDVETLRAVNPLPTSMPPSQAGEIKNTSAGSDCKTSVGDVKAALCSAAAEHQGRGGKLKTLSRVGREYLARAKHQNEAVNTSHLRVQRGGGGELWTVDKTEDGGGLAAVSDANAAGFGDDENTENAPAGRHTFFVPL
ncbi:hypothetical protein HDU84_002972 [Entophlyctis sp. JEL0112]|nr:hypothetical protein HDU84_002972 [Entophlyctis sp. JEL0112]